MGGRQADEPTGEIVWNGYRLSYEERGSGQQVFVLLHGLLLPAGVNGTVATMLAQRGHRIVLLELLGHGRSDKPVHATDYRMEKAGEQVVALLDHLRVDQAVIGGVSLGANVALQVATAAPDRVRGIVCEMPVLERGTIGVLLQLAPLLLALRYAGRPMRWLFRTVQALVPRARNEILRAVLDTGGEPREMAAVMHGFSAGPICPPVEKRREIDVPALVIGHPRDWMHPMDDADALARELPNARLVEARSFFELRTRPDRIVGEIDEFLRDVWSGTGSMSVPGGKERGLAPTSIGD